MPRGTDRRAIIEPLARDLDHASLLLKAMQEDSSPTGRKFNLEREVLFRPWERLVRTLGHYKVPGDWQMPIGLMDQITRWLDVVAAGFPVNYPRPRSQAKLGPRIRVSNRLMVKRYRSEVEAFCRRWHLEAWWAVPAIVQSHIVRVRWGTDVLLGIYTVGTWGLPEFTIAVNRPGVSDEGGVRINWDGRPNYQSSEDPGSRAKVPEHVREVVEARLGRPLTKQKRRSLSKEIDPQILAGRQLFLSQGWEVVSPADLQTHARWLARRLLDPAKTYLKLEIEEFRITGAAVHKEAIRRACRALAGKAGLRLS